jgi:hypothetical protein
MSSPSTKTAPYGSWKSPITSDLIAAQSITLSELCLDGGYVYWLEGRPQEQGRCVVVRADADGRPTDIIPPPDMIETDRTVTADIQHLLHTAHDANAVSALDPTTAPQETIKAHHADLHFA